MQRNLATKRIRGGCVKWIRADSHSQAADLFWIKKVFSVRHVNYGRLEHQKTVEGSLADVKLKLIYPTAFMVLWAFKGTPLIICT